MLRRPQDDYYRRDVGAHSWQLRPADLNLLQLKVQQGTSMSQALEITGSSVEALDG